MNFNGRNVLVTGAAKGIGREIALGFAKAGANVMINYASSEAPALQLKEEIEKMGVSAYTIKASVSDDAAVKEMIEKTVEIMGSIDILVNNAGITKDSLVLRMKEEDFDSVIATNLKGTFLCSKYASKYMSKNKYGRIINISSVVGIMGNAGQANYSASKAGVIGLTKSFAKEFSLKNINVNAIAPGFIESDMTEKLPEDVKTAYMASIPVGRFGKAKDVANAALFLASEYADYITGQVIHVDGGMIM